MAHARRRGTIAEHRTYQQGLLWSVASDPRVPKPGQGANLVVPVRKVPCPALRERLLKDGQILTYNTAKAARGIDPKSMPDITVD